MYPKNWSPNSLDDRELLARTLEAEAGNQGLGGMIAVGAVIRNRTGSGQSIRDTILAPGQFSAWNSWTKYAQGAQGQNMAGIRPSAEAYSAADSVLANDFIDVTGGATHYYNPELANPKWGQSGGGNWKQIGSHVFGVPKGEEKTGTQDRTMAQNINSGFVNQQGFIDAPYPGMRDQNSATGQQPTAQQPTAQQPNQSFFNKLAMGLADPRTRMALTSMSRTELGKRLYNQAAAEGNRNKTAEWLAKQPGGQPYADAIMEGALTGDQAYKQWLDEKNKTRNVKEVDGNLIDIDTGEIIYGSDVQGKLTSDQFTALKSINSDLLKRVKPFEEVRDGFRRIQTLFDNPSGVSDYALAVSFAKILDPGSVAREGEVAAVANAGSGVMSTLRRAENFFKGDGTLPAPVRQEIMYIAGQNYSQMLADAQRALADAQTQADGMGIDRMFLYKVPMPPMPELNLPERNPTITGDEKPVEIGTNGKVPEWATGYSQDDWNRLDADLVKRMREKAGENVNGE